MDGSFKILVRELGRINKKLDVIIDQNAEILDFQKKILSRDKGDSLSIQEEKFQFTPDALTLLSLPSSLRKTMMVVYKLGRATSEDIAKETRRLRPVESAYANRLVRLGFLRKRREGRKVYFHIE